MALQTFNNLEVQSSVKNKINTAINATEKLIVKSIDFTATADFASGTVTSQTSNSITDSGKAWTTNQFVNKGVRLITATGEIDYAIVASNTATQLVFDDAHAGFTFASYRILSTFEITQVNSITSVGILSNDCAILLPDLTTLSNRVFIKVYLEQSNNNGKRAAIICRGTQRQRGMKYGFLNYKYEGVEFWKHDLVVLHWDILQLDNIKRYTSATMTVDTPITSATYTTILPFATSTVGDQRRFEAFNRSGILWFKYMSITPLSLNVNATFNITRSGGGSSIVDITVRVKKFVGGTIVDSTNRGFAKFSGDDTKPITISIPFTVDPYDEITIIAKRDAGTVVIEDGSNFLIKEM